MTTSGQLQQQPSRVACFLRSNLFAVLFLAFCGYVPLSECLTSPFIHLDDTIYVTENPYLQPDQPWSRLITDHIYYQRIPVTMVSYRLNAAIFGLDSAWSFRLVNGLFHVAAAVLLLKVLERLGLSRLAALTIAACWAMHPTACESVAWISQRRNVLGFFFGILAFYAYVRWYGRAIRFILPPLAFALALFSSPLALGWLPVFVALELLGGPPALSHAESSRIFRPAIRALIGLAPMVLLSAATLWIGVSGYARTMRPPPGGSVFTALLTDTDLFLRYVLNGLIPARLSAMYGVEAIESLGDLRLWANLAIWVVLVGGTILVARSRGRAVLGWLWVFGGLGPACNIVAIGYPMQDRYFYLSLPGLLLVVAEAGAGLLERQANRNTVWRHGRTAAMALFMGWLSYAGIMRSVMWSDSLLLMQDAVETQPQAALSHIFYARQLGRVADEYRTAGKDQEALEANRYAVLNLEEGLRRPDAYLFNPLYAQVLLAGNLVDAGEPKRAVDLLEGRLPAPDAPKLEFSNGSPCYTFVGSRYQFTYTLSREAASLGYSELARAWLHLFIEQPLSYDEAKPLLKQAAANSVNALKVLPGSPEAQCLRACVLLAEESYIRKDIDPDKALAEARERARQTERELQLLSQSPTASVDLKKQVSLARVRALGCLGLARARFEPLLKNSSPPDEIRQRFTEAVQWAGRACEMDPTLGESFMYLARIQHFLLEAAEAQNDPALAEQQRKVCIEALQKVPPESACYLRAQQNLQALNGVPLQ